MQFQFFSSFKASLCCSDDTKRNALRHQSPSARKHLLYKTACLLAWEWYNGSGPLKPVTLEGRKESNGKDTARTGKGKGMHEEGSMQSTRVPGCPDTAQRMLLQGIHESPRGALKHSEMQPCLPASQRAFYPYCALAWDSVRIC